MKRAAGGLLGVVLVLAGMVTLPGVSAAGSGAGRTVSEAIGARLAGDLVTLDGRRPVDGARLRSFYAARRQAPAWVAEGGPGPAAQALLEVIGAAEEEGLNTADYHLTAIKDRFAAADGERQAELDLLLTDAVMAYGVDLRAGRFRPGAVSDEFALVPPVVEPLAVARGALNAPNLKAYLAGLAPPHAAYDGLRQALRAMRAFEKAGGWPKVTAPLVAKLEPGMSDPMVPGLRRRLAVTGELAAVDTAAESELYDDALRQAVTRFQTNNGLLTDGVIGARTVAVLNISAADRVGTVLANLERARWLPSDMGERRAEVNIAGFALKVLEKDKVALEMPVVVGTKVRRTPIFSSRITSLIFNPTWTVPPKLAREDMLPKLRKDPNFLAGQGIQMFDSWDNDSNPVNAAEINWQDPAVDINRWRLRQEPGAHNALGQVKFNLPNRFDVYLHDTPHREKFERSVRTFSSGCVRLGNPLGLMEYLLGGMSEWSPERRQQALKDGVTRWVTISRPLPVYLLYQTAALDETGTVQFREDIYDRDLMVLRAIRRSSEMSARGHDISG
jgi:murein L,D-transpeptidase YcbB/YkuD